MLGQVFEFSDIPKVASLFFIEMILSADNAIVLGVLSHRLPEHSRRKALYIGMISALFLRAAALFAASQILSYSWLEALGGAYLVYLGIHHFYEKQRKRHHPPTPLSFWKAIILIEFFDLAFAIDSIVAGLAFIASSSSSSTSGLVHPKLWIVYAGGMLGVLAIRYAADLFSGLIERFPNLKHSAYLLVLWIGLKLILYTLAPPLPAFEILFWGIFALLFLSGFRKKLR